jgi:hypothetical protein
MTYGEMKPARRHVDLSQRTLALTPLADEALALRAAQKRDEEIVQMLERLSYDPADVVAARAMLREFVRIGDERTRRYAKGLLAALLRFAA